METDLEKLKGFILTGQAMAEQGECLMLNVTDILNEIERLQALTIQRVSSNEVKLKFNDFINKQQDLDSEFVKIVNDNFWDLL